MEHPRVKVEKKQDGKYFYEDQKYIYFERSIKVNNHFLVHDMLLTSYGYPHRFYIDGGEVTPNAMSKFIFNNDEDNFRKILEEYVEFSERPPYKFEK